MKPKNQSSYTSVFTASSLSGEFWSDRSRILSCRPMSPTWLIPILVSLVMTEYVPPAKLYTVSSKSRRILSKSTTVIKKKKTEGHVWASEGRRLKNYREGRLRSVLQTKWEWVGRMNRPLEKVYTKAEEQETDRALLSHYCKSKLWEGLLKCLFWLSKAGWIQRICISIKISGDANNAQMANQRFKVSRVSAVYFKRISKWNYAKWYCFKIIW